MKQQKIKRYTTSGAVCCNLVGRRFLLTTTTTMITMMMIMRMTTTAATAPIIIAILESSPIRKTQHVSVKMFTHAVFQCKIPVFVCAYCLL